MIYVKILVLFIVCVGASKTKKALYSQAKVVVFGQNAGWQHVAMGVCAKYTSQYERTKLPWWFKTSNACWKST